MPVRAQEISAAHGPSSRNRNLQLASAMLTALLPLIHALFIRGVQVVGSFDLLFFFSGLTLTAFICLTLSYQYLALSKLPRYS